MEILQEDRRPSVHLLSRYDEFFNQGDQEKALGLKFSAELVDRAKMPEIPRMQVGFYKFVVMPAYDLLYQVFQKNVKELHDSVKQNQANWQELHDSGKPYVFGMEL
jgi:hypothetical protein